MAQVMSLNGVTKKRDMISSVLFLCRANRTSNGHMPTLFAIVTKFLSTILYKMTKSFTIVALDRTHIS